MLATASEVVDTGGYLEVISLSPTMIRTQRVATDTVAVTRYLLQDNLWIEPQKIRSRRYQTMDNAIGPYKVEFVGERGLILVGPHVASLLLDRRSIERLRWPRSSKPSSFRQS